jgi:hypothetical protein
VKLLKGMRQASECLTGKGVGADKVERPTEKHSVFYELVFLKIKNHGNEY